MSKRMPSTSNSACSTGRVGVNDISAVDIVLESGRGRGSGVEERVWARGRCGGVLGGCGVPALQRMWRWLCALQSSARRKAREGVRRGGKPEVSRPGGAGRGATQARGSRRGGGHTSKCGRGPALVDKVVRFSERGWRKERAKALEPPWPRGWAPITSGIWRVTTHKYGRLRVRPPRALTLVYSLLLFSFTIQALLLPLVSSFHFGFSDLSPLALNAVDSSPSRSDCARAAHASDFASSPPSPALPSVGAHDSFLSWQERTRPRVLEAPRPARARERSTARCSTCRTNTLCRSGVCAERLAGRRTPHRQSGARDPGCPSQRALGPSSCLRSLGLALVALRETWTLDRLCTAHCLAWLQHLVLASEPLD